MRCVDDGERAKGSQHSFDVSSGSDVRLEKGRVTGKRIGTLACLGIDCSREHCRGHFEDRVAALEIIHIGDDETRPMIGECADEQNQDHWNQRQETALRCPR